MKNPQGETAHHPPADVLFGSCIATQGKTVQSGNVSFSQVRAFLCGKERVFCQNAQSPLRDSDVAYCETEAVYARHVYRIEVESSYKPLAFRHGVSDQH